jgi:hypothetical protein
MRVKMILPALTEAVSPFFRPIKYALFPPLGLATLAAYLDDNDEITLQDEHVERLTLDDDPELVVIQTYIRVHTYVSAVSTQLHCRKRPRAMRTVFFWDPVKIPGRSFYLISVMDGRSRSIRRPRTVVSMVCRLFGAI